MAQVYEDHVRAVAWGLLFDLRIVGAGKNKSPGRPPKEFEEALLDTSGAIGLYRRCLAWDRISPAAGDLIHEEDVARLGLLVNMGSRRKASQVAAAERCRVLRDELEEQGERGRLWIDLDYSLEYMEGE